MSGMRIKGFQLVPATEEHSTERNRSPDACSNCYQSTTAVKVPIPVHMQLAGYNEITARYFNHINNGENFIVPYSVNTTNWLQIFETSRFVPNQFQLKKNCSLLFNLG